MNLVTVKPYDGAPPLHLAHNADDLNANGCWYRNFEYQVERERGLDFREDLFSPCELKFDLGCRSRAAIIASTERPDINRVFDYRQAEINRRGAILDVFADANELVRMLAAAADHYAVIALALRSQGFDPGAEFGVAPSTLRQSITTLIVKFKK